MKFIKIFQVDNNVGAFN